MVQTTETVALAQQADRRSKITADRSQCEKCGLERPSQSLMPSYEKELSSEELENLIAYLFSLRRK
jgi:hypothetical protein